MRLIDGCVSLACIGRRPKGGSDLTGHIELIKTLSLAIIFVRVDTVVLPKMSTNVVPTQHALIRNRQRAPAVPE